MSKSAYRSCHSFILASFFLVLANLNGFAQTSAEQSPSTPTSSDSAGSLADLVRGSKAQKNAHAKKVLTDEDMEVSAGPLPRLKMEGAENADEVVAAISAYKIKHTPEETEKAVRI